MFELGQRELRRDNERAQEIVEFGAAYLAV